jgi:hypothetical protein
MYTYYYYTFKNRRYETYLCMFFNAVGISKRVRPLIALNTVMSFQWLYVVTTAGSSLAAPLRHVGHFQNLQQGNE